MAGVPVKEDSVYDFLYVDQQRIGLLLSQFGNDGIIKELERQATSGSDTSRGMDFKVLKGDNKENESQSLTRRFDPQWLVPLTFLDRFHKRFKTFLPSARIGDLVRVEGKLWLADTVLLKALYATDSFRNMAMNKAMENAAAAGIEFNYDLAEMEMDLVTSTPPQVHFHLHGVGGSVWSTLRPNSLITPPEELAVKHGAILDGYWHVVGIKDANPLPEEGSPGSAEERLAELQQAYAKKLHVSDVVSVAERLRELFGRPSDAYGVTPLMIFRPIGA
jgi:hypothetical protein